MITDLKEIHSIEEEIRTLKSKLADKIQDLKPQKVTTEYLLKDFDDQEVRLEQLFGDKEELILVFNMGKSCAYCTLWADGFNGLVKPLNDRAAFVIISPDSPEVQKPFYLSRDWKFRMLSYSQSDIAKDYGFFADGKPLPGIATFIKKNNEVYFYYSTSFGPGDNFCNMWDIIDILPSKSTWHPKFIY